MSKSIAYTFGLKPASYLDRAASGGGQPGPGQYNIGGGVSERSDKKGGGFGTEKRSVGGAKSAFEVPGPGQYTNDRGLGGPAIGFGTSRRSFEGGPLS